MSDFEVKGTPEQQAKLFAALAKAQVMFGMIEKTRTVRVTPKSSAPYTFDYAPLDEVLNKTRDGLTANGLAVLQPVSIGEQVTVRTVLVHEGGASVESSCSLSIMKPVWDYDSKSWGNPVRMNNQEIGGVVTYWRRYPLCGILGVVAEEDDDANAADGNERQMANRAPATRQTPPERKTAPIPDYRTKVDPALSSQAQQAATPVPPQVAVSAPAGPSPAVGAAVPQNASDKTATSPPASAASEPAPDVAKSGTSPGPIAQAVAEHVATQPVPMTEATGKAIRMALKAAGYNASTQEQAKAKVRSIVDKPSEGMTEAEGQHILEVLASERASA